MRHTMRWVSYDLALGALPRSASWRAACEACSTGRDSLGHRLEVGSSRESRCFSVPVRYRKHTGLARLLWSGAHTQQRPRQAI